VGVLDLEQVRLPFAGQFRDQCIEGAGLVFTHLRRQFLAARCALVLIHHVDFAKHLVELFVVDHIFGLADRRQDEVYPIGQRAAEIVDPYRAAMRKRIRQEGRDDQHLQAAGGGSRRRQPGRRKRDRAARKLRFPRAQGPQGRVRKEAQQEARLLHREVRLFPERPFLSHAVGAPTRRGRFPEQKDPCGSRQAAVRDPQRLQFPPFHQHGARKRRQHLGGLSRL
jgi:hypothetical protein